MASSSPAAAAMTTAAPIPKEVMDAIMRAHFFHGHLPSQAAAIAVLVLYLVASAAVLLPTVQTRAWFMLTVVVTGGLEAAGYAFRLMMLTRTPSLMLYAQMESFLVIPPVLLAIVLYICLARLLAASPAAGGPNGRPAYWTARLFTASDILCLSLQGAGGGITGAAGADAQLRAAGVKLLIGGLIMQLGFFSLFTALLLRVHLAPAHGYRGRRALAPLFGCMYATIALMYARNVFRVIQFVESAAHDFGPTELQAREAYLYALDAAPMLACFALFAALHPGRYLPLASASSEAAAGVAGQGAVAGGRRVAAVSEGGRAAAAAEEGGGKGGGGNEGGGGKGVGVGPVVVHAG